MATKFYGRSGLITESVGEISVDRYGMASGRVIYKMPERQIDLIPAKGLRHPLIETLGMDGFSLDPRPGFWVLACQFAGVMHNFGGEEAAVYELHRGTGEEPIVTSPKFVSTFGGKPSAPLNGALFVNDEGIRTRDDKTGVFDRFRILKEDGTRNPFAGQEAYVTANGSIWTKRWTDNTPFVDSDFALIAKIDPAPPGSPPTPAGHTWLFLGGEQTERGGKNPDTNQPYGVQKTLSWRCARWNTVVYAATT